MPIADPAFGTGELWGDGAGAADALTVAFVTAAGGRVLVEKESTIACIATVAVTDADHVELQGQLSLDSGTTWVNLVNPAMAGTVQEQEDVFVRIDGDIGDHLCLFHIPCYGLFRVQARRVGGGAGTTLLLTGFARPPMSGAGGGGIPAGGTGVMTRNAEAFGDGAGAALALTLAYVTGPQIPTEKATKMFVGLQVDTPAALVSVDFQVTVSTDGGATFYILPATNSIVGGIADTDDRQEATPATAGNHSAEYDIVPDSIIVCWAKRTGTAGNLLALATLYR